jgi:hypothetical protein
VIIRSPPGVDQARRYAPGVGSFVITQNASNAEGRVLGLTDGRGGVPARQPAQEDAASCVVTLGKPDNHALQQRGDAAMTPTSRDARIAGFVYLLLILLGPIRLIYIPGKLFVHSNAAVTASNIAAHEWLFRFGIAADLLTGATSLILTLLLYWLFVDVSKKWAMLMLFLGLMDTPLYFFNILNDSAVMIIVRGDDFLSVFNQPQRDALITLFLRLHGQAVVSAEVFWGLWLLPLAVLVWRWGTHFLLRCLAVWLFFNGLAYLMDSFVGTLLPHYEDLADSISTPLQFGELAFMLWLLIFGARPKRSAVVHSAAP